MNIEETIVGIDLGTTNSVISVLDNERPMTLLVDNNKLLPSVVHFSDGKYIVGQTAKNIAILEPENTVSSIKRKIGQDIDVKLGNKSFRPEEISSLILQKLINAFKENYSLPENLQIRAVITVPAYFSEEQREATKQAAELANIKVERIINEPTAAALSFGLNKIENASFAIYDLGGGTFDISVVENHGGIIEVLSTTGDTMLGGDDFDLSFADFIWDKFVQKNKIKGARNSKVDARLRKIAEENKIKLSTSEVVEINETFFYRSDDDVAHLQIEVTRDEFEKLIYDKIEKTVDLIEQAVNDAKLELSNLEGIILVGGSSRIPLVSELIEKRLDIVPALIELPDEAVSHGATIQGAIINHLDLDTILIDITPHSLGVKTLDVNSVSMEMANIMQGGLDSFQTYIMAVLIEKNTPLPVRRNKLFSPVVPFQQGYEIQIFQGENPKPERNKFIGEILLKVERPTEHGGIDVSFELDINGILKVSAVALGTDDQVKATFKSSRGMKSRTKTMQEKVITLSESTKKIIDRAENLLKEKSLNYEDKTELSNLLEKYKEAKSNDTSDSSIESELLDLLYYIEQ